jgi:hypothetical protein
LPTNLSANVKSGRLKSATPLFKINTSVAIFIFLKMVS